MLYRIAALLLVAWLLGVGGLYDIGVFVHIFLIVGVTLILLARVDHDERADDIGPFEDLDSD